MNECIDRPFLHLILLLFAAQTALTTLTCIAEYKSWEGLSEQEKAVLDWLYMPYFGFGRFSAFPFSFIPFSPFDAGNKLGQSIRSERIFCANISEETDFADARSTALVLGGDMFVRVWSANAASGGRNTPGGRKNGMKKIV